jgi:cation diffusion facilitator family transporter
VSPKEDRKMRSARFLKPPEREDIRGFMLLALLNEALTKDELMQRYDSFLMHYGLRAMRARETTLDPSLFTDELQDLSEQRFVEEVDSLYHLTARGKAEATKAKKRIGKFHEYLSTGTAASKVSASANLFLSALKLLAGFLSNSMGLISDGFDSSIDVFSSAGVYLGTKYRKELYSNLLILALMFIGGISLGYGGLTRLIRPEFVEAGLLPAFAAIVSAVTYYALSIYQRFVGKRTGNLSLVSQSLESGNHMFIAAAVLVGIVFAAFGLPVVDSLVSVGVAILILKSATEISIETVRIAKGEQMNLSRFKARWETWIDEYRSDHLKFWTLLKLEEPKTVDELTTEFERTFSRKGISYLEDWAPAIVQPFSFKESGRTLLDELVGQGWIAEKDGKYQNTQEGNRKLQERLRHDKHRH